MALNSQLERIKDKQRSLRELKIKNSFGFSESNQDEFNRYIKSLPKDTPCKYSTGIHGIVNLCNNPKFECKYRGEIYKSLASIPKKECKRDKMAKIESLFS